jgi:hypothetical protein
MRQHRRECAEVAVGGKWVNRCELRHDSGRLAMRRDILKPQRKAALGMLQDPASLGLAS